MCRFSVPATAQSLRPARDQLREWLRGLHWPADELEDLVYAVSEALANAVEHAYPPAIAAQAWVKVRGLLEPDPTTPAAGGAPQRRVRIEIRDHGRWRPQLTDLTDPGRSRGRGLALMTLLTDDVAIDHSEGNGTRVTLLSRPVATVAPAAPAA